MIVHIAFIQPQSERRYLDGELRRPDEIDKNVIKMGHTIDSDFQAALDAANDIFGNLDKDPALLNTGVRDPMKALNL